MPNLDVLMSYTLPTHHPIGAYVFMPRTAWRVIRIQRGADASWWWTLRYTFTLLRSLPRIYRVTGRRWIMTLGNEQVFP